MDIKFTVIRDKWIHPNKPKIDEFSFTSFEKATAYITKWVKKMQKKGWIVYVTEFIPVTVLLARKAGEELRYEIRTDVIKEGEKDVKKF